jgi:tRNA pseudouridine13 synthase
MLILISSYYLAAMEVDLAGVKRPREPLVSPEEADTKKPRLEKADTASAATPTPPSDGTPASIPPNRPSNETEPYPVSRLGLKPVLPGMPPSLELVTGVKADLRARKGMVGQEEVGIIGYAGPEELRGVRGVIKQRFVLDLCGG